MPRTAITQARAAITQARTVAGRRLAVRDMQNSIVFNASADKVAWADNAALDVTNITIEHWVKITAYDNAFRDLANKWDFSSNANQSYATVLDTSNEFSFYIRLSDESIFNIDSGFRPALNRWYHLVATFDGSNLKTYVNGVAVGTPVAASGDIIIGNSEFHLGTRVNSNLGADMCMPLFRMYGAAATAAQVADMYYDNKTFETPVMEMLMTEGSGTSITSTGSYAGVGTMTSVAWTTASPFKPRTAVT